MAMVFQSDEVRDAPGVTATHVLIVGCGSYPALAQAGYVGVRPLGAPAKSAVALADWFLGGLNAMPPSEAFHNPTAPLGSIELLASPDLTYRVPGTQTDVAIERPTVESIGAAFEAWLGRLGANPESQGVFFFCGHGIGDGASQYLVADDFGELRRKWDAVFNVTKTTDAAQKRTRAKLLFLVDACMEFDQNLVNSINEPMGLLDADALQPFSTRDCLVLRSTGANQLAYAPVDGISFFTSALIRALRGLCGKQRPGHPVYDVFPQSLLEGVQLLLDLASRGRQQRVTFSGSIAQTPFHVHTEPLRCVAQIHVDPGLYRSVASVYLEDAQNVRTIGAFAKGDEYAELEIPHGAWTCGVEPKSGTPFVPLRNKPEYIGTTLWKYRFEVKGV